MKAPSTILRKLSFRWLLPKAPAPAVVAPLPVPTQFDLLLTTELNALELSLENITSGNEIGLIKFLDGVIATQKITLDSLSKSTSSFDDDRDRVAVEKYLDSNIVILDACNHHAETLGHMKNYVDSLKIVAHLVEVGSGGGTMPKCLATVRALEHLDSCHVMEKRFKSMEKHGSSLRRVLKKRLIGHHETIFSEIVCGSKVMALMGCKFLELGLSFDQSKLGSMPLNLVAMKQSQPITSSWSWLRFLQVFDNKMGKYSYGSLVMNELLNASKELKELMMNKKGKKGNDDVTVESCVERVKRSCNELEDLIEAIEGRVNALYKSLIDVRMALLGIPSHQGY
ncbi:hypothetical protein PIB30_074015 [Stylosanthes scabra]|uniref:Uncharacterized protein n=1 Tax=Stylosanthes scabra TaxID=79078 RepID=A0ABU6UQ73_9FABA|nr:hypothetical protein [Stylosanthes scabra]